MKLDKLILKFMWKNKRLQSSLDNIEKIIRKTQDKNLESDYNKNVWHQCRFGQRSMELNKE